MSEMLSRKERPLDLTYVRYFVVLAEHLHFTRAAEHLGIAQPALSQQIHKLEATLSVRLFHRTKRRVELTGPGKAFLPHAVALLQQSRRAQQELLEIACLKRGSFHVGASGTIAAFLLPDLLASFRRHHPEIVFEITQQRSETVLDLIEMGKLDLGLVRLPFRETNLEVTPLKTEVLYAALPPVHRLAQASYVTIDQLKDDPFIMCVSETEPFYDVILDLCRSAKFQPNIISAGAEYPTVFRLVGMNMGVSIVSELATKLSVTPGPSFVRVYHPRAMSTIVLISGRGERMTVAGDAFREFALTSLRGQNQSPGSRGRPPGCVNLF